jgi:hypothetical protein
MTVSKKTTTSEKVTENARKKVADYWSLDLAPLSDAALARWSDAELLVELVKTLRAKDDVSRLMAQLAEEMARREPPPHPEVSPIV